jgi:hypothetical protein
LIALVAAALFLMNRDEEVRVLTLWLSGFELLFGAVLLVFARELHQDVPAPVSLAATGRVGVSA